MDDLVSKLSEIRSRYNCFDEDEAPFYRALSEAIRILSKRADGDTISRQAAIEEVHGAIYEFFDICDDDEESPMTYKDEKLLEINKAISGRIKALPSAQTEIIRCKDCRYNNDCEIQYSAQSGDEFFCGCAERKDNG